MIDKIIEENERNFTKNGLKYSTLKHYIKDERFLNSLGVVEFVDGSMGYIKSGTKQENDCDILQSLLLKKLGFKTPSYMPVLMSNGNVELIRDDIALDDKSLINSILDKDTNLNVKISDFFSGTSLAKDYHNVMNELVFIPELKLRRDIELNILQRFFINRDIKRSCECKQGSRPFDTIFSQNNYNLDYFFTDEALNKLVKLRLIKMANLNTSNELKSNLYVLENLRVKDVLPISSGIDRNKILSIKSEKNLENLTYQTEFSSKPVGLKKAISLIKKNETINRVFDEKQQKNFAETLWETSAIRLAAEYADKTGYKVDYFYKTAVENQKNLIGGLLKE